MVEMAIDRLIAYGAFRTGKEADELFFSAMKENFEFMYEHSPHYRLLCDYENFTPEMLKTHDDIYKIPYVFVSCLKMYDFKFLPDERIKLTLTSSGTGGMKTKTYLDEVTLDRILEIAWRIHEEMGVVAPERECNYLLFSYDPNYARDLGTAFSDESNTRFTKIRSKFYAIQWKGEEKGFVFSPQETAKKLLEFASEDVPLRICGFPAHLLITIEELRKMGYSKVPLHPESFFLTGGGWKTFEDRKIEKPEFRKMVSEFFCVKPSQLRDSYGFVEHGIPYLDCEEGNLHIPNYSRVVARDPRDLSILENGNQGLLHFYTPYHFAYPVLSVLSTDYGVVNANCPCGRPGSILTILGRAGRTKWKGCAFKAMETLKEER
ncbi:MAG: acyl-protein synthetase [Thermoplasmata archaeon]